MAWYEVLWHYLADIIYPYFRDDVYPRFLDIVGAPIDQLNMIWILAPLVITMVLIQLYFGRHKQEEIGWNTAYGNSIVLIFVTLNLFQYLYQTYGYETLLLFEGTPFYKSIYVSIGLLYAFVILLIDFTHLVPKKIAFFFSSSITVTVTAFIAIVLVYSDVPFDTVTLSAALIIFLIVFLFFRLFRWTIPASEEAEKYLERKKKQEEQAKKEKRIEQYKAVKHIEHHIKKSVGSLAKKADEKIQPVKDLFKK